MRDLIRTLGKHKKLVCLTVFAILLSGVLVVMPCVTVIVYEIVFSPRYETAAWQRFDVDDFESLRVERSDFDSGGVMLAGYRYEKEGVTPRGLVILAHGMGGGGHNGYMPFIDHFTSNGYAVFTYDATGNDQSGGDSVEGLPQGLIDLDRAICHAATIKDYDGLPLMLFGHSWGGYAVGNVLCLHPEVRAAVIVAGFNESEDLLYYHGVRVTGTGILLPYMELYEWLKFGTKYTETTAVQGMQESDAQVMIVHSRDDQTVPCEYGYDKFYAALGDQPRVSFVLYEDRGHSALLYSDAAARYAKELEDSYALYLEQSGEKESERTREKFMQEHLDPKQYFAPDPVLMERVLSLYDGSCN